MKKELPDFLKNSNLIVTEITPYEACHIVTLNNENQELIDQTENALNNANPIIGDLKTEELYNFDLQLINTINLGVKQGKDMLGFLSATTLELPEKSLFPKNKKYTPEFKSLYINTLNVKLKPFLQNNPQTEEEEVLLEPDVRVFRMLIDELKTLTGKYNSIVLNIHEENLVWQNLFAAVGFKGIGCVFNFFGERDSVFMEYSTE